MSYNPEIHHRRSIRLKEFDYSQAGAYFVTICAQNRECLFGDVTDGKLILNDAGKKVQNLWSDLPWRFSSITLDVFIIMPNHIHGIIMINAMNKYKGEYKEGEHKVRPYRILNNLDRRGESCIRPSYVHPRGTSNNSIGRVIQAFKSITIHQYIFGVKQHNWQPFHGKLWQRNYYEHIIRDERDLNQIRDYIINNPIKWALDEYNPENVNDNEKRASKK